MSAQPLRRRGAIALSLATMLAVSLSAPGCRKSSTASLALDGSPRFSNDEGVATTVSRAKVILDGRRTYRVGPRFVSFSTFTAQVEPMVQRRGQYVLIGHHGATIDWMAGVSAVIGTDRPQAFYQGHFLRMNSRRRMVFRDGTVLTLAPAVRPPKAGQSLSVIIDARRHRVVEVHVL